MIRVAVLYPNAADASFDVQYYKDKHMKLVREKLDPLGMLGCEVDAGLAGMDDQPPPYLAIGYLFFETADQFHSAFDKVGAELVADVPNYTNIQPVILISDYEKT